MGQVASLGDYSKVADVYKNRYRQVDVKNQLEKMYGQKCCYCETGIGVSDYPHIEHHKPKALRAFHNLSFQWINLHWSCGQCNQAKGDKWDDYFPILDPSVDEPSRYFRYDLTTCETIPLSIPSRAQTTIEHLKLNRDSLLKARKRIRNIAYKYIEGVRSTKSPEDDRRYKELLTDLITPNLNEGNKAEYSMLIKQIIDELLP